MVEYVYFSATQQLLHLKAYLSQEKCSFTVAAGETKYAKSSSPAAVKLTASLYTSVGLRQIVFIWLKQANMEFNNTC